MYRVLLYSDERILQSVENGLWYIVSGSGSTGPFRTKDEATACRDSISEDVEDGIDENHVN